MKGFKLFVSFLLTLAFIFVCGVGIAQDKAPAAADDGGKTDKLGPPKGDVLYKQDFEEEDDTDAWTSDGAEIEWQKGGANGSKGCLKIFNPGENTNISCEKYLEWYDAKTFIDFDYCLNGLSGDEFYFQGWGAKAKCNVHVDVKSPIKGKWAHGQVKASAMRQFAGGGVGKNDTFRNLIFNTSAVEKDCKDPNILLDNIVITATDKRKTDVDAPAAK